MMLFLNVVYIIREMCLGLIDMASKISNLEIFLLSEIFNTFDGTITLLL